MCRAERRSCGAFQHSAATAADVTGFTIDTTCYNNFIIQQLNNNGNQGSAPDKVCHSSPPSPSLTRTEPYHNLPPPFLRPRSPLPPPPSPSPPPPLFSASLPPHPHPHPGQVYLRTDMPKHTRNCLLVNFCSSSGYHIISNAPGALELYTQKEAQLEQGAAGADKMFDFLVYAPAARPSLLPCPPLRPVPLLSPAQPSPALPCPA